ncbi:MAG: alpha/beta fold hydrolase [Bacteroidales bacterium]
MVRKEILIPTSAGDVFAVYTSAETPDSVKPLIIMCHGMMMSGSLNPIRDVAEGLNEGGYDTLRLDFRGNGRSSGSITDMTPLTEVNDLLSVIEYTVGHSEEFGTHGSIVLCGHSLGGLVSLLVASALSGGRVHGLEYAEDIGKMSSALAGLFLLAPAVNVEADSKAGRVGTVTFDPENIPEIVEVWGSGLSKDYFVTARELDTFKTISAYHGPACVLLGERDRLVEMNLADKINAALPQAELHIIPRGDHLFSRGIRQKAVDIALEFLSRL